jgi:threonylcarbamoyladenosine tRNA methylthiotransferase MtaB
MNKFDGESMDVLYEQSYNNQPNMYEGYTPNYIRVVSECNNNIEGKILETKLAKPTDDFMTGKLL